MPFHIFGEREGCIGGKGVQEGWQDVLRGGFKRVSRGGFRGREDISSGLGRYEINGD